jgi:co-chaperonin GroES (HSP10)
MSKKEEKKPLPLMPVGDTVLLEIFSNTMSNGVLLPTAQIDRTGTILAIGKAVPGNMLRTVEGENGIAVGDKVLIPHVKQAQFTDADRREYVILPSSHITTVVVAK